MSIEKLEKSIPSDILASIKKEEWIPSDVPASIEEIYPDLRIGDLLIPHPKSENYKRWSGDLQFGITSINSDTEEISLCSVNQYGWKGYESHNTKKNLKDWCTQVDMKTRKENWPTPDP